MVPTFQLAPYEVVDVNGGTVQFSIPVKLHIWFSELAEGLHAFGHAKSMVHLIHQPKLWPDVSDVYRHGKIQDGLKELLTWMGIIET